ncbi:helix-turn-helix transcriptional regulator [Micromonospora sp. WMMD712]|uniref:helix-turn-helix domain-containing protein n=1 Tax=Micromonospora sp. WMMD712 TaxID=3016096 RepID=UPI00249A3446|nr:helix-turn-helix transcriptional regulator [Micromonospora sp. WMMD712]WFE61674.1 helix-turn-helix transcriptional regulator [Micromonospora sp. WMMD712]
MHKGVQVAMVESGHTAESLAAEIGVDPKTAARWASRGRIPQTRHRAKVAELLGRDVLELWPDVLRWKEPAWFRPWTEIEREATGLRCFESVVIPGLLQTEAYARAVLACGPLVADADDHVEMRLQRCAAVFDRPRPPLSVFVVDEAALRRGKPEVMRPQLDHLLAMAQRPMVMVYVLPLSAGLHPGRAGPFVIATTPDGDDVGYLDDQAAGHITNDVAPLWAVWDTVRSLALPRDQSIDFLGERPWLT